MLEVPSEFFNDEDKSFMEAGDMDDSKEETNGHTLDANNVYFDSRGGVASCHPRVRRCYGSMCHWETCDYDGQLLIYKRHSKPPLNAICVRMSSQMD